ncbi:MAG: Ldh family oxidoreductase [Chloroflexi bacterium]|nr:Ldh family oxidoreductase [Chloroflexota bacterium]MDA1146601.1 Ldh family oxidoreductase [Chloroflexota bacterium]MQC82711.1 Ldh family oxidoreductase [Chloroflexota bacterium]
MPIIQADALRGFITDIFAATGASREEAAIVGNHLVEANLMGHDSHGIVRTLGYITQTKDGGLVPAAKIEVIGGKGAAAVVDVNWNFGQVGATRAMEIAIERAREHGIGAAVCRNCGHIGRVGAYGQMAAAQGMIGIACVNNPGTEGLVAPFGGMKGRMGTNPFTFVIPTDNPDEPFVLDFATSVAAEGKVRVARNKGVEMPPGYLLDSAGNETTNPADLYQNESGEHGALLPFGGVVGYKAYGLAMAVEALSGALSGSGTAGGDGAGGNGVFMMALDISAFTERGEFDEMFGGLDQHVKKAPVQPGREVITPGVPERRRMAQRLADGIDVDEETWRQVCEAASMVGVAALAV